VAGLASIINRSAAAAVPAGVEIDDEDTNEADSREWKVWRHSLADMAPMLFR
jgi:hypothetical protein